MESYLPLGAATLYLRAGTFIIHPPWGIFNGAGAVEQQHVALYVMLVGLAILGSVTIRRTEVVPSVQILVAAATFAIVYSAHGQLTPISVVGHNATIVFVVIAAAL